MTPPPHHRPSHTPNETFRPPCRQLLDVAKQLQNFEESEESEEYLKGYKNIIANAKVDWTALGSDFDDVLNGRKETKSTAEKSNSASKAKTSAEEAALEKVRATWPKSAGPTSTYGVVIPFLSIAPSSPSQ